jgi:hypothetical protein
MLTTRFDFGRLTRGARQYGANSTHNPAARINAMRMMNSQLVTIVEISGIAVL